MFIRKIHKKTKNKTYTSVYLAESYRNKDGKVRHKHISNITKWSDEMIANFEKVLKGEKITTIKDLKLSQGKSFGAIKVVLKLLKGWELNKHWVVLNRGNWLYSKLLDA